MVERFNTLLKEVKDDLHGVINYSSHIEDEIRLLNKANKRTLGKCRKWMGGTYEIYLNPMLLEMSNQLIKDVIAHELIHTQGGWPQCRRSPWRSSEPSGRWSRRSGH